MIGHIISMQAAMGTIVRLKTRSLYECLMQKSSLDAHVCVDKRAFDEIVFWSENYEFLNGKRLVGDNSHTSVVYSDASKTGYRGYLLNEKDEVMGP